MQSGWGQFGVEEYPDLHVNCRSTGPKFSAGLEGMPDLERFNTREESLEEFVVDAILNVDTRSCCAILACVVADT